MAITVSICVCRFSDKRQCSGAGAFEYVCLCAQCARPRALAPLISLHLLNSSTAISTMCLLHQSNLLAQNVWFTTFNIYFLKKKKKCQRNKKTHAHIIRSSKSNLKTAIFYIETANFGRLRNHSNRDKIYKAA